MKDETRHIRLNETKWDGWAKSIDSDGRTYRYLRRAQSKVISLLEIKAGVTFLDIGCGTGWAVGQAAKLVNDRGSFYGVDLSPKMIEKAKENFRDRDNFYFIKSNVESIPLGDKFFDIIFCTNSFHHYLHPEKALTEMRRLLKMGGKLYILDPTADKWRVKIADKIIKLFEPEHVKIYSTKEFRELFTGVGLKYLATQMANAHQKIHIGER